MYFTSKQKEIVRYMVHVEQFSLAEIVPGLTEFSVKYVPPSSSIAGNMNAQAGRTMAGVNVYLPFQTISFHDGGPLLVELQDLDDFIIRLFQNHLLEKTPNRKTVIVQYLIDNGSKIEEFSEGNEFLKSRSSVGYQITDELKFILNHGFLSKEEVEDQRKARRQSIKEWLPLAVSVIAVLASSFPSWMNLLSKHEPQVVKVEMLTGSGQDNVNRDVLDKLQGLTKKVDELSSSLPLNRKP